MYLPRLLAFTLGALAAAYLTRRLWRKLVRAGRGYYQSTIEPQG